MTVAAREKASGVRSGLPPPPQEARLSASADPVIAKWILGDLREKDSINAPVGLMRLNTGEEYTSGHAATAVHW